MESCRLKAEKQHAGMRGLRTWGGLAKCRGEYDTSRSETPANLIHDRLTHRRSLALLLDHQLDLLPDLFGSSLNSFKFNWPELEHLTMLVIKRVLSCRSCGLLTICQRSTAGSELLNPLNQLNLLTESIKFWLINLSALSGDSSARHTLSPLDFLSSAASSTDSCRQMSALVRIELCDLLAAAISGW